MTVGLPPNWWAFSLMRTHEAPLSSERKIPWTLLKVPVAKRAGLSRLGAGLPRKKLFLVIPLAARVQARPASAEW